MTQCSRHLQILQSLYLTMAQLKLRNQVAKHEMYRKFFWILIGLVVMVTASMVVMAFIARPGARKDFWHWRWFDTVCMYFSFFFFLCSILGL
jgi:hypothetical protein